MDPAVILASQSPRRMLLLPIVSTVTGTVSPDVNESPAPGESSDQLALRLAKAKLDRARSVPKVSSDNVRIVSADTVVSLEGIPLGKPSCESEARDMLMNLRGRSHTVITAVAIGRAGSEFVTDDRVAIVATEVEMRDLDNEDIQQYIARGEPFDKAGGYAIQDVQLQPVDGVRGCFPNVVGLPLCAVRAMLENDSVSGWFMPTNIPCDLCRAASEVLNEHGFWAPIE
jgi:MAF protein